MKLATLILFLLVGSCMSEENNSSNDPGLVTLVLKGRISIILQMIMTACEKNNPAIYSELKSEEKDAISCDRRENTRQEHHTKRIIDCYEGILNKSVSCLNEKYLPKLLVDAAKNIPRGGYKVLNEDDMRKCNDILRKQDVDQPILDCIGTYDKGGIPPTKTKFCEALRPAAKCLVDGIESNCEDTPDRSQINSLMMKFLDDIYEKEGTEDNQTTIHSLHTKKYTSKKSSICSTASSELQNKRIAFEAEKQRQAIAHEMLMNKSKLIDMEQQIEVPEINEYSQIPEILDSYDAETTLQQKLCSLEHYFGEQHNEVKTHFIYLKVILSSRLAI
ncbi:hypothetical protein JTB14_015387 [Gonioctena quinquepunctata]|nr:hypothetical protein JTB14_015387 [Gonioctena quinquepunctata]